LFPAAGLIQAELVANPLGEQRESNESRTGAPFESTLKSNRLPLTIAREMNRANGSAENVPPVSRLCR
jgi:hypothetical protein